VSFARRGDKWCFAETGVRNRVTRLQRINEPFKPTWKKHAYSKKDAVDGRHAESCMQWVVVIMRSVGICGLSTDLVVIGG